jgi:predicted Zn-dependent protease
VTTPRITAFEAMIAKNPANALIRFGLATELLKVERWAEAIVQLELYLAQLEDEGNGWLKLADALAHEGRGDEARAAIARGIVAANKHGHVGLAAELAERRGEIG